MGCTASRGYVHQLLFASPDVASYGAWSYTGELIWVPLSPFENYKKESALKAKDEYAFPCRLVQRPSARFMVIYFHKNGDDLGMCKVFANKLSLGLEAHVLVVEYPGYGLCWDRPTNAESMCRHALAAVGFAQLALRWPLDSIILYGACIGVGPAMAVASQVEVAGLVLVGAFLSVKKLVRHQSKFAAHFIPECFPNEERAPLVRSPTLIFHGAEDKLVPVAHAGALHKKFTCSSKLVSLAGMGHHSNMLKDENHLLLPIREFFNLPSSTARKLCVPPWAFQREEALRAVATFDATLPSMLGPESSLLGSTGQQQEALGAAGAFDSKASSLPGPGHTLTEMPPLGKIEETCQQQQKSPLGCESRTDKMSI